MPPLMGGAAVPGKVMASEFDAHEGGRVEDSGDGGKDVGFLGNGNTLDYLLNVGEPGDYSVTIEAATGQDGAAVEMLLSGQSLGKIGVPNTGAWNKWGSSQPVIARLEKGPVVLRVRIVQGAVNVRSVSFEKKSN